MNEKNFDVIVIGAGHAGAEAALAAARLGAKTLIFTIQLEGVAYMACNPSIGGTAKGHIVREIDALGGEMGVAADKALLQIKMLNRGKGPAVYSLRGQADKARYHEIMLGTLTSQENLTLIEAEVADILVENCCQKTEKETSKETSFSSLNAAQFDENDVLNDNSDSTSSNLDKTRLVKGVVTADGQTYFAPNVIIAAGVYLNSRTIRGKEIVDEGPSGLKNATALSKAIENLGLEMRRFKTGTPARVAKDSIDFSVMEVQKGEDDIGSFSFLTADKLEIQHDCWLTYTNPETHRIIRENIESAPMYSGVIKGVGARYCPSIEDKVMRFKDKDRHQIFIEPEGLGTDEMYVQGMSTSFPKDVQEKIYRSVKGLENVKILKYAYAIEYDCIDPTELTLTYESKSIKGLYTAGQINGSSGYEEAACQGLIAGINAALSLKNQPPFTLGRDEAYIGVLADDLVTKGTNEPYRMMTARAEYRILLRQDNADLRLTEKGYRIGLASEARYQNMLEKKRQIEAFKKLSKKLPDPDRVRALLESLGEEVPQKHLTLAELIKRPAVSTTDVLRLLSECPAISLDGISAAAAECAVIEIKYEGYLKKALAELHEQKRLDAAVIPPDIDYLAISGLRIEARQKLHKIRPENIGQASRIPGVSPADITVLIVHLKRR